MISCRPAGRRDASTPVNGEYHSSNLVGWFVSIMRSTSRVLVDRGVRDVAIARCAEHDGAISRRLISRRCICRPCDPRRRRTGRPWVDLRLQAETYDGRAEATHDEHEPGEMKDAHR